MSIAIRQADRQATRCTLRRSAHFPACPPPALASPQNDFLRPFVVVMRHSRAVEIRELIIRCVSQMVLARVANVKSGWKSMFMVRRGGWEQGCWAGMGPG